VNISEDALAGKEIRQAPGLGESVGGRSCAEAHAQDQRDHSLLEADITIRSRTIAAISLPGTTVQISS